MESKNLFNAAANIRKALWGSSKEISTVRKPLRDSLKTDENSVLFTRSIIRNHNEHFRLDKWWRQSGGTRIRGFRAEPLATRAV
jgi:hypothetical protein